MASTEIEYGIVEDPARLLSSRLHGIEDNYCHVSAAWTRVTRVGNWQSVYTLVAIADVTSGQQYGRAALG